LPFVFERFYRASPVSGEAHSGRLGLAIAQAIAQAQGGAIEYASEPGVSSQFTVISPLTPPTPDDALEASKQKLMFG
jgi:signal transduction histidine kinase